MMRSDTMIIGFTGTRHGMTGRQAWDLDVIIGELNPWQFHHGGCVGSDEQAHCSIAELFWDQVSQVVVGIELVIHPPTDRKLYASNLVGKILAPKPYLERNRDIVDACDLLIAAPHATKPSRGTRYTMNYARKQGKPILELT